MLLGAFTRPHTMLGTAAGVASVTAMASWAQLTTGPFVCALSAALLMNVCIVGVNQVFDVEIDRVNKPGLPIASGRWSRGTGAWVAGICGASSFLLGMTPFSSRYLMASLAASCLLGMAYSAKAPLLRWKRHPGLAAGCILFVRAVVMQAGFFLHAASFLPGGMAGAGDFPPQIVLASSVMAAFSVAIALLKDTPDLDGDAKSGVRTFTVRLGAGVVLKLAVFVLTVALAGAALACWFSPGLCSSLWRRVLASGAHASFLLSLLLATAKVDPSSQPSLRSFYLLVVWRLFYAEYFIFPLL